MTADNADAIDMPIKVGKYTLHASLKWNAETNSFDWNSFQYMGNTEAIMLTTYCILIVIGVQFLTSIHILLL